MNLVPPRNSLLWLTGLLAVLAARVIAATETPVELTAEQRDFQQWRFGMFIHLISAP